MGIRGWNGRRKERKKREGKGRKEQNRKRGNKLSCGAGGRRVGISILPGYRCYTR